MIWNIKLHQIILIHIHICTYTYIYNMYIYIYIHTCIYKYIYICNYMYTVHIIHIMGIRFFRRRHEHPHWTSAGQSEIATKSLRQGILLIPTNQYCINYQQLLFNYHLYLSKVDKYDEYWWILINQLSHLSQQITTIGWIWLVDLELATLWDYWWWASRGWTKVEGGPHEGNTSQICRTEIF